MENSTTVVINKNLYINKGGIYYYKALLQGRCIFNWFPLYGLTIYVLNEGVDLPIVFSLRVRMGKERAYKVMKGIANKLPYSRYELPLYIRKGVNL